MPRDELTRPFKVARSGSASAYYAAASTASVTSPSTRAPPHAALSASSPTQSRNKSGPGHAKPSSVSSAFVPVSRRVQHERERAAVEGQHAPVGSRVREVPPWTSTACRVAGAALLVEALVVREAATAIGAARWP